jgi:hypothetical protein
MQSLPIVRKHEPEPTLAEPEEPVFIVGGMLIWGVLLVAGWLTYPWWP